TVETTFGSFTLSERWTGCDSYIIVHDTGDGPAGQLFNTATAELFTRSALNTHYFFVNDNADPAARAAQWQSQIGAAIGGVGDEVLKTWWAEHVRFVTQAPADVQGSLGIFVQANPSVRGVGIDRAQRWDTLGSHSDVTSTFVPMLPVFGYVSRWYNF